MLQKRIQGYRSSTLLVLLTWLVCLTFAGAGALLAAGLINTSNGNTFGDVLSNVLRLIIVDFGIFLISVVTAIVLSRKVGLSVSGDKSTTNRQVGTIFISIIGILIGLYARNSVVESPKPPIFIPIIVTVFALIVLYVLASSYVFTSTDTTRRKIWTPILYFIVLTAPSAILCSLAK